MRHAFHPEAEAEFVEAVQFYHQRGARLGQRFADEVRAAIARVLAAPTRWRVFPYAILYTIESDDSLLILAIKHAKRRPGNWRHRTEPE